MSEEDFIKGTGYKNQEFEYISYEEIEYVEADNRNIKINGRTFLSLPTKQHAYHTVKTIKTLQALPTHERSAGISSYMAQSMNMSHIKVCKEEYQKLLCPVKVLSSSLFLLVFVLLPLYLYSNLFQFIDVREILICMLCFYAGVAGFTYLVIKKIYRASSWESAMSILSMVFSPVNAVHPLNNICEGIYSRFDFITIAAVYLKRKEFLKLCRTELRRIQYFQKIPYESDFSGYWEMREHAICSLLRKMGVTAEDIAEKYIHQDSAAVGYCPLCRTEYRQGYDMCTDCGVKLENISSAQNAANE